jgi:hypothetical protein
MAHVRTQVRDAAVAALTGLPTTGASVFKSRVYPVQERELPCLLVYMQGDFAEGQTLDVPEYQRRTAELRVEGLALAGADMEETLNEIAVEVEEVLADGLIVDGKLLAFSYAGADTELRGPEGSKEMGAIVMRFATDLLTLASEPDALLS